MHSRTVFENVALPLELAGIPRKELEKTVQHVLRLSGLEYQSAAYPNELTLLQKQKVAIARALANKPKVLLCEEITTSLDPKTKQSLLQLLQDINQQLKLAIVVMTHEIDVIKTVCKRVAVLHQGEIVEQATVLDFFMRPQSEIAKEFIRVAARQDIPVALRSRLRAHAFEHSNPVLRIAFVHSSIQEPAIIGVMQGFNLAINIMQAHLEHIGDATLGIMIVELIGDNEELKGAIQTLKAKTLQIEVLGYAPRVT
jgi:D-methionine transport system ATP-binding protein